MKPAGHVVSVHVWRVPRSAVPVLLARSRLLRPHRFAPFVKLCGTTRIGRFEMRATDWSQWLLLGSFADQAAAADFVASPLVGLWNRAAGEQWRAQLRPLRTRGTWSGIPPFVASEIPWDGPVVSLTRASLVWHKSGRFRRAVPGPARAVRDSAAWATFGFSEAPLRTMGTLSIWPEADAARQFAHGCPEHRAVVRRTGTEKWYSEDLYTRFALERSDGQLAGRALVSGVSA